jgi:hypothetical protein
MKVLYCDLKWVKVYIHLKRILQNYFKNVLKLHSTSNTLIFAIPSLMIIITFHNIFKIFLCVNNTKEVVI